MPRRNGSGERLMGKFLFVRRSSAAVDSSCSSSCACSCSCCSSSSSESAAGAKVTLPSADGNSATLCGVSTAPTVPKRVGRCPSIVTVPFICSHGSGEGCGCCSTETGSLFPSCEATRSEGGVSSAAGACLAAVSAGVSPRGDASADGEATPAPSASSSAELSRSPGDDGAETASATPSSAAVARGSGASTSGDCCVASSRQSGWSWRE
mmetsp:Transcript_5653/g.19343  ORF Transcript_5653/g.19343 Transcript_5653/m.19343 type:complete len:209 (-) Transcript_5653:587-1213(-)